MKDKAIEKINTDMQKDPSNLYAEAIGHYILDRIAHSETEAELILAEDKSLNQCLTYIKGEAKKVARGGVAVVEDDTVYKWADEYFGLQHKQSLPAVSHEAAKSYPRIDLDFADFL